jgi:L-threonylcarbamoyladenylate synthase
MQGKSYKYKEIHILKTKRLNSIDEAVSLLKNKEVVAFPTETVYGLGADATSDIAVSKIFAAKGRPSDNPLIVHIGSIEQLDGVVSDISDVSKVLMHAFWPGPLTIILPKKEGFSDVATAGLDGVGVRMPSHPIALELLKAAKLPIVAPSANASGKPSPTLASHVLDDLDGKIAGILDGGATGVGLESTVIDCTTIPPVILRPGGITKEQIEEIIGEVRVDSALVNTKDQPRAPGMKYSHYAPNAPMTIVKGSPTFFQNIINEARLHGQKVGILTTEENKDMYDADVILTCGKKDDISLVAQSLYSVLREFNNYDIDIIFSESFSDLGLGQAVMNRLLKASNHRVTEE